MAFLYQIHCCQTMVAVSQNVIFALTFYCQRYNYCVEVNDRSCEASDVRHTQLPTLDDQASTQSFL